MTNPEFGKKNEFVRQKSTKWNNISDDIIFQQSELKVTADSASKRSIEQARSQVIEAFSKAQPESRDNQAEKERGFAQRVGKIDHYFMQTSISQEAMASYMVDLAGVLIDVKPAALICVLLDDMNLDSGDLAKMITEVGLQMASDQKGGNFFISKTAETAEQLKQGFYDLRENNKTKNTEERIEIDHRLGKLLGYPETAINQDIREPTKLLDKIKGLFKKRHDESFDSRCYVHSPGHENEEFEQYEKPIHEFMDKYCPESTKVLKDMKNSKGRSYRW